jgi:hypothetical protein
MNTKSEKLVRIVLGRSVGKLQVLLNQGQLESAEKGGSERQRRVEMVSTTGEPSRAPANLCLYF